MLTSQKLVLRNLTYHARGNLAVALGVAVGSAVLTGALLVGDSLRESLRARSLSRLGWVHQTLSAPRFVGDHIVGQLAVRPLCGAIVLRGAITADSGRASGPATQAQVIG